MLRKLNSADGHMQLYVGISSSNEQQPCRNKIRAYNIHPSVARMHWRLQRAVESQSHTIHDSDADDNELKVPVADDLHSKGAIPRNHSTFVISHRVSWDMLDARIQLCLQQLVQLAVMLGASTLSLA